MCVCVDYIFKRDQEYIRYFFFLFFNTFFPLFFFFYPFFFFFFFLFFFFLLYFPSWELCSKRSSKTTVGLHLKENSRWKSCLNLKGL